MTTVQQSAHEAAMKVARDSFREDGVWIANDLSAACRAYYAERLSRERTAIEADALRRAAAAINCGCPAHSRPSRLYTCAYDDCPNQLIGEILALIPDAAHNDGGE